MQDIYIEKHKSKLKHDYFPEYLKQRALKKIQEYSGKLWSDYNAHDPGVTILENLCFALAEIHQLTDTDIKNLISDKLGNINPAKHGLYMPHEIYSCSPVTISDIRLYMIDAIPELCNIIIKKSSSGISGMLEFYPLLREDFELTEENYIYISTKIYRIFNKIRPLCTDISKIKYIEVEPIDINGEIELSDQANVEQQIAEIYYSLNEIISPTLKFRDYSSVDTSVGYENIFDGPLLKTGYANAYGLHPKISKIVVSEITKKLLNHENIISVKNINLIQDGLTFNKELNMPEHKSAAIKFPRIEEEVYLKFYHRGQKLDYDFTIAQNCFNRMIFNRARNREKEQDISSIYKLPKGEKSEFKDYYSIQHNFPKMYNLLNLRKKGCEGDSQTAKTKQLKAFIALFEQNIFNLLLQADNIKSLFSTDENNIRTYFFELFENFPGSEYIIDNDSPLVKQLFELLAEKTDDFYTRKNEIIDFLISLYGENYYKYSINNYDYYLSKEISELKNLKNKIRYLKKIPQLNYYKFKGVNFTQRPSLSNISGLEAKLSVILGIKRTNYFLTDIFLKNNTKLSSDNIFDEISITDSEYFESTPVEPMMDIPLIDYDAEGEENFKSLKSQIYPLSTNELYGYLLRYGVDINNYKITLKRSGLYAVFFKLNKKNLCHLIANFNTFEEAFIVINRFRRYLIKVNEESEGLYIIEHNLLLNNIDEFRNKFKHKVYDDTIKLPDDFYSNRITVVLPSWTGRFNNKDFRQIIINTIKSSCPAHILPQFIWLDLKDMQTFDFLYKNWRNHKYLDNSENVAVFANRILWFLIKRLKT